MRWRAIRIPCVRQAAILAMAFALAGPAFAQTAAAPPPPPPRGVVPSPDAAGCNTVEKPQSAGGASMVPEVAGQQKNWQPPGGEITFTVRSFVQIPSDALVLVCFRWKRIGEQQDRFITARPVHLDLTDSGRLLKVTVVVPPNLRNPPPRFSGDGEYAGLYLVPLAEVRILVLGKGTADGSFAVAADVSHVIGVTNPFWALLLALPDRARGIRGAQHRLPSPAQALWLWRPRPDHPHHHHAGRLCEPVAVADDAVDLRGRGLGGLRHGALGRADRGHHRHAGAARHFGRRDGRTQAARQRAGGQGCGRGPAARPRRRRASRAGPISSSTTPTASARSTSRACRCSISP